MMKTTYIQWLRLKMTLKITSYDYDGDNYLMTIIKYDYDNDYKFIMVMT